MKKISLVGILIIASIVTGFALAAFFLWVFNIFEVMKFVKWGISMTIIAVLVYFAFFSHKLALGKGQGIIFFINSALLISIILSSIVFCFFSSGFDFSVMDWLDCYDAVFSFNPKFLAITLIIFIIYVAVYCGFIDRNMIEFMARAGLRGKGKLKQLESNLENSRWMTNKERDEIFKHYKYSELKNVKKDGVPVMASLTAKNRDMDVVFNSIIIGSTGSGKTTTFVSPMIQLLASTSAGSSMIITDPKGELFSLHSQYLKDNGYDVKVIDLRDTYSSYRWNPLDSIWEGYQQYAFAHKRAHARRGDVTKTKFKVSGKPENFNYEEWYEFDGVAVATYEELLNLVKVAKKKSFDEVYEDLNDLVSVLVPVENEKDPMWEKGARSITFAVLLAMLEDSENPELGMKKEKFNFFNMTKILQNSSRDYKELRDYFKGRSPLSRALSLSKQVCDAAENTRASYMSVLYDKLTMFNDARICALTSASDFTSEQLASTPPALFLKLPD
ncbi:MAG: type IV secretory system conjugative DNA transfer family protein, partial [Clostridia bacterium]|nr:type IV secretory system conjugative DNA transfer family protein [Clostridia bacterium]